MASFGDFIGGIGNSLNLPEIGLSEMLNGQDRFNNKISNVNPNMSAADSLAQIRQAGAVKGDSTSAPSTGSYPTTAQQQASAQAAANAATQSYNNAYLNDQEGLLRGLLTRNANNRDIGLRGNEDQYNTGVGTVNQQKQAQVTTQNQGKQSAYGQINRNANAGYRSLAQIIGRASGTGSSAFQELLPDVIGRDTSAKRQGATDTFGQNLSNIDTSTNASLADLMKQKKANESTVMTGYENNNQNIQGQLSQNAGARVQNNGGGFDAVRAAQNPYQTAINSSKDNVESFFSQYRTPFTPQEVNPNLAAYSTDRSAVNGQAQGANGENPYSNLLRKRLQGQV